MTIIRKSCRIAMVLTVAAALLAGVCGCSGEGPEAGGIMDIEVVSVPSQFKGYYGDEVTLEGTGFEMTDIVLMQSVASEEEFSAPVSGVDGTSVSFRLPEGVASGEYRLYVSRDGAKRLLGRITIVLASGLDVPDKEGCNIKGFVGYNGTPLQGVAVSDGCKVTTTDRDGFYWLASEKKNGYVFVSVPSGYETEVVRTVPQFFTYLRQPADVTEQCDFNLYPRENTRHRVVVFADTHLVDRVSDRSQFQGGFMREMTAYLEQCKSENIPVYCIALGDLSWDTYWESNNYDLSDYLNDIQGLDCAVYSLPGNHDNDPSVSGDDFLAAGPFRRIIGPTDYSFNLGDIHYIMLDNVIYDNPEGPSGSSHSYEVGITAEKLAWLEADLGTVDKSTPVVLCMHVPMHKAPSADGSSSYNFDGAAELEGMLSGYDVNVLTGHTHYNFNVSDGNIREHNIAAVCATWWWTGHKGYAGNHICRDGSVGGYKVFDMDGTGISWRYKCIGKDEDYQFRAYDRNSIKLEKSSECPSAAQDDFAKYAYGYDQASDENIILVNVFDWAEDWSIKIEEDGAGELDVTRVKAYDPLHVISYNMLKLDKGSQMTFPTSNVSHFFRAQAASATSAVRITVTDEEGHEYVQTMERPKSLTYQMD